MTMGTCWGLVSITGHDTAALPLTFLIFFLHFGKRLDKMESICSPSLKRADGELRSKTHPADLPAIPFLPPKVPANVPANVPLTCPRTCPLILPATATR